MSESYCKLDFSDIGNLSYSKPVRLVYKNQIFTGFRGWATLYAKLASLLQHDYPQILVDGIFLSGGRRLEISQNPHLLRKPKYIAGNLYIETNHSAPSIAARMAMLLHMCGVSLSEVSISYTSTNGTEPQDEPQMKSKREKLYNKLYTISRIYDDPTGISLDKIIGLLGANTDCELVQDILDHASWSHQITDGKYLFADIAGYHISSSRPSLQVQEEVGEQPIADFDKDKYIEVLMCRYRNGITFDSLDFDNFREIYEDFNDSGIDVEDAVLEGQLRLCGVFYNDRLFPAEGIMDDGIKEKLFSYIDNSFSSGKQVLYYQAIFEDLADDFACCYTLADANMLRGFIEFTAEKGKYYFAKDYMSIEAGVKIDNAAEVGEYLLSAGKPTKIEDVCRALTHIPEDKVASIIKLDNRFRRNAKGEYFHADIFEISDRELDEIAAIIDEFIDEDEYAIWTEVWHRIQETMPVFLENNLYLSSLGVRNAISQHYLGRFNFNAAVISRPRDRYEMRDVYQLYAKHHPTFTAEDIYSLSKELDTVIYFDALSEVSVRVSHDLFISPAQISFDVDAVDGAIGSFLSKDYIRVRKIDSYLVFPNVGYEWNEYLLESYLLSYSKKFALVNNGLSLNNVAGFVVKQNGKIQEFVDACADFLADGHIELKKKEALDYLASTNVISRRSYKDIDLALRRAAQIRTRKE